MWLTLRGKGPEGPENVYINSELIFSITLKVYPKGIEVVMPNGSFVTYSAQIYDIERFYQDFKAIM